MQWTEKLGGVSVDSVDIDGDIFTPDALDKMAAETAKEAILKGQEEALPASNPDWVKQAIAAMNGAVATNLGFSVGTSKVPKVPKVPVREPGVMYCGCGEAMVCEDVYAVEDTTLNVVFKCRACNFVSGHFVTPNPPPNMTSGYDRVRLLFFKSAEGESDDSQDEPE